MEVAVIGAGTMGHGIAYVSAMVGHTVIVNDVDRDLVQTGISAIESTLQEGVDRGKVSSDERTAVRDRITGEVDLAVAVQDAAVIIEAVPEDLALKKEIVSKIAEAAPADAVIGSNTSSLSITELASVLETPGRVVGLHFFNPPYVMDLVEVIVAEQTSPPVKDSAISFVESLKKTPIEVTDSAGFASSRLGIALGLEAMRMVETGVASVSDIDTAMTEGYGHPMGPLKLSDLVGLDVRLDIAEYLQQELGDRFHPPQLLKQKVRADKLGKKTGEGFYVWDDGDAIRVSDDASQ